MKHAIIEPNELRQPDIFERITATCIEFHELAGRYSKAVAKLDAARTGQAKPRILSAYLDLTEILDQSTFLLGGLHSAIEDAVAKDQ